MCNTNSCGPIKNRGSEYWINKNKKSPYYMQWMIGDQSTGIDSRGTPGETPYIGENGNWWIGGADTGKPATAVMEEVGPQSATELF